MSDRTHQALEHRDSQAELIRCDRGRCKGGSFSPRWRQLLSGSIIPHDISFRERQTIIALWNHREQRGEYLVILGLAFAGFSALISITAATFGSMWIAFSAALGFVAGILSWLGGLGYRAWVESRWFEDEDSRSFAQRTRRGAAVRDTNYTDHAADL